MANLLLAVILISLTSAIVVHVWVRIRTPNWDFGRDASRQRRSVALVEFLLVVIACLVALGWVA